MRRMLCQKYMLSVIPLFITVLLVVVSGCDDVLQIANDLLDESSGGSDGSSGFDPFSVGDGSSYPKMPVLMVHGLNGSSDNWDGIKNYLVGQGYDANVLFTIDLVPNNSTCDPGHIHMIYAKVEQIIEATGYPQVDVIGHSNGGSDLSNYMRYSAGTVKVRNWVTIGGANSFACTRSFLLKAPEQLLPFSSDPLYPTLQSTYPIGWNPLPPPWVPTDLDGDGTLESSYMDMAAAKQLQNYKLPGIDYGRGPSDMSTPGTSTLYTSIYSVDDKIVANEDSYLDGGRNIAVGSAPPSDPVEYYPVPGGVTHIDLLFQDTVVYPLILQALQGNGWNFN